MAQTIIQEALYPSPSLEVLKSAFLGKSLEDVEGPAAIVDRAAVVRNCQVMLEMVEKLNVGFRAHVKTHKTVEVARMQVGDASTRDARAVVSTIAEAEQLFPLFREYHSRGRKVNILYGIPPSRNAYARLKHIRDTLGPETVSFMIDHPSQLQNFVIDAKQAEAAIPIFVKIDVGSHRAGLEPFTQSLETLLQAVAQSSQSAGSPKFHLLGFYSHNSGSYGASSPEESMQYLAEELDRVSLGAKQATQLGLVKGRLIVSVGATPTVASAQNLVAGESSEAKSVQEMLKTLSDVFDVELHAGNYPFLDMQQLATHSRPLTSSVGPTMTSKDIAMRVMAEVLSVYTERDVPEALVGAGCLALGREPCKSYPGWGVVAPDLGDYRADEKSMWDEVNKTGWIVGRISQEHGVLTWTGDPGQVRQLKIGQKLSIFPNHSCISAAGFQWYLVIDSSLAPEGRTKVVDVWIRCRGW